MLELSKNSSYHPLFCQTNPSAPLPPPPTPPPTISGDNPSNGLGLPENSSYPPLFRQTNPSPSPPTFPSDNPCNMLGLSESSPIDLPLIDFQSLTPASLEEVSKEWGIFRLVGHGIPPSLSIKIQDEAKKLLSHHSFESKQTQGFFPHPIKYFWDHPSFTEKKGDANCLEGLRISFNELQPKEFHSQDLVFDDSSFRCLVEEFGRHLAPITWALFNALAPKLELEGDLASYQDDSHCEFLALRYLCCASPERHIGFQPHTDGSIFSVLDQDHVGGLQILRNHNWFDVPHVPNTFVVLLGDMLKVLSNEEYKCVKHRVLTSRIRERISLGYFTLPKGDIIIKSSKYRPFTYTEYKEKVKEDYRTLGFKVGIEHFELNSTQPHGSS